MLWALATQNTAWFDFLQTQKFGPLMDYYAALPGGGTREGTGYGTALNNLFGNYIYWKASTGEDLAGLTPHTRETIDYWVHATVPTRDRFAPIADLSRESIPNLYDYHENLVHEAVVLSAGTPQARRGTWWLQHNSVNGVASVFNIAGDLLPYPDAPSAPTDLMYHARRRGRAVRANELGHRRRVAGVRRRQVRPVARPPGPGLVHVLQGRLAGGDQQHLVAQRHPPGSGRQQRDPLRAEHGAVIPQNQSDTRGVDHDSVDRRRRDDVSADLTNAYSASRDVVQSWTRTLELSGDVLRVTDACSVAPGVRPIFQLQVPALPVLQADGSIQAGGLHIVLLQPANATFVAMDPPSIRAGIAST